jgi:hypothetical protein
MQIIKAVSMNKQGVTVGKKEIHVERMLKSIVD